MAGPRNLRITKGALVLLVATAVPSLLYSLVGSELKLEIRRLFTATGISVWTDLKIWQVVTSPLLELDFVGLFFSGLMLWLFLPALENWWGPKRFLGFALYTSVAGAVVGTLVGALIAGQGAAPIAGLSPFVFAGMLAFGVLFGDQQVRFFGAIPMTGRQVVIGVSGLMIAFVLIGQEWPRGCANIGAMAMAWLLTSGRWRPKLWWLKHKQRRIRRHLRVVPHDDKPAKQPKRWLN